MTLIIDRHLLYKNLTSIDDFSSSNDNNIEDRNYINEMINNSKPKKAANAPSPSTNHTFQAFITNHNHSNLSFVNRNHSVTSANLAHINKEHSCSFISVINNKSIQKKQSISPFHSNSKMNSQRSGNILQLPTHKTEKSNGNGGSTSFISVSGLLSQFSEKTNLSFISNDRIKKIPASERKMTEFDEKKIMEIFSKMFLFSIFPEGIIIEILSNLIIIELEKGDYLYEKGSEAKCFYIIIEGMLEEIDKDEKVIKQYGEWDYFGYECLMNKNYFAKNEGSVKCIEDATLYVLSGETFLMIRQKIIKLRLQERFDLLNNFIFFKSLDCIAKHLLAEQLEYIEVEEGEKIKSKGKNNGNIYLISSGSVAYLDENKEIKIFGVNAHIGLIGKLLGSEGVDVITREKSSFFLLKDKDLKEILCEDYIHYILFSLFKEYIQNNPYFADIINETNNKDIFSKFQLKMYTKYEKINEKNQNPKRIMLILHGNFFDENTSKALYSPGSVIGDNILTVYYQIPNNLYAFPECLALEVELNQIADLLGEEFRISTINFMQKVLKIKKVHFFSLVSNDILNQIVDFIKVEKFFAGQKIIEEGAEPLKFYIIMKGTVRVTKASKQLRILEKESTFGEIAFIKKCKRTATVSAITSTTCYVLTKEQFELVITKEKVKKYFKNKMNLQDDEINLPSLRFIKHLGKGKFGLVSLVHNKNSIYAIKAISRIEADRKRRFASYLIWERRIMLNLDNPFIIKMIKSFQNEYFVFLLIEYVNGSCLKDVIRQHIKLFSVGDVRFYIANLLIAIDYMHKKKIVHRDIKPNNILINANGYLKLIDFGTSKFIRNYTNTIIGTPHYIAPEILIGKGYLFSVDFWSLGICAFELFYHKYPFGYQATEIMQVYNDIMYNNFKYPVMNKCFTKLNELIDKLLEKQVNKRYCSLEKIKTLELFEHFKWDELYEMKLDSPYIPETKEFNKDIYNYYSDNYEEIINKEGQYRMKNARNDIPIDIEWANEF